tara:strand:+ start:244 stop:426 length:183 start_codon:yes stop_codon:yes gene_type:complete
MTELIMHGVVVIDMVTNKEIDTGHSKYILTNITIKCEDGQTLYLSLFNNDGKFPKFTTNV